jgi:hypothetical protein
MATMEDKFDVGDIIEGRSSGHQYEILRFKPSGEAKVRDLTALTRPEVMATDPYLYKLAKKASAPPLSSAPSKFQVGDKVRLIGSMSGIFEIMATGSKWETDSWTLGQGGTATGYLSYRDMNSWELVERGTFVTIQDQPPERDTHVCNCKPKDLFRNMGCTCRPGGQREVPWAIKKVFT